MCPFSASKACFTLAPDMSRPIAKAERHACVQKSASRHEVFTYFIMILSNSDLDVQADSFAFRVTYLLLLNEVDIQTFSHTLQLHTVRTKPRSRRLAAVWYGALAVQAFEGACSSIAVLAKQTACAKRACQLRHAADEPRKACSTSQDVFTCSGACCNRCAGPYG